MSWPNVPVDGKASDWPRKIALAINWLLKNQTTLAGSISGAEPVIAAGTTAQYWRGDKSWQTLNKTAVGLANVDNTADSLKNVLTATKLVTARNISISGDMVWTVSFDGSGNVTSGGTLATVNSNTGSFGSATQVGTFTVNAKGLLTAAANITVTPAWSNITSTPTTLAGYSITGTKANFDTACTDGNFLYVGDVTQYTDELAQDAVGAMVDTSLVYVDATPLLTRAALTGDATASQGSNALTLATVNSNVGSFGSATQVATFTVNAKGLTTAAGNVTITPAVGSITGLGTGVATALGVNVGSAGAFVTFNGAGGTPSSLTLTNATGLPAAGGGTGIASYAIGDLIYASASTTLSKLADVATGNALISGGVTTAPSWGKIGLTTHISGTLAAGNGGTGVTSLGNITKSDDTNVTLTLGGTPTGAVVTSTSFTLGWTGTLGVTRGGLGFGTTTQGDILYADASNSLAKLAKNTTATRYLSNTGTSNNPAWAQVDLTNGVTGILPSANGGTANGFTKFSGPAASEKTFTLPNASDTVVCYGTAGSFTTAQTFLNSSGVKILDTDASHTLGVIGGSNLTANRTLTLTTGDANRTLDISAGSVTISTAGAALIDDADASAQRTTLGLGTSATVNTGTSGATVPLLNGALTTWANGATFGGTVTGANLAATTGVYVGGFLFVGRASGYNCLFDADNGARMLIGDTSLIADPSTYYNATTHAIRSLSGGTTFATFNSTGLDLLGLARCDSFRIDQTPTAQTIVCTHTITISVNGTDYLIPMKAA